MSRWPLRCMFAAALMLPGAAVAEPIQLKLSFFTSDRSVAYQTAVKPFVEAVNSEGQNLIEIKVYFSGELGKIQKELPQSVLDRTADIAFIVPGQNPERFPDNALIELPGLFQNVREATLTYSRLVATGALAGYSDFFVIGAYATEPEIIHSRKPAASLADLKGQRIRVNNPTQELALKRLGMEAQVMAFNQTTPALSRGDIDAACVPPGQLFDVGIGRLTSHHYYLGTSVAPLALVMNRQVYESLPQAARDLIKKYSGEWTAARFIEAYEKTNGEAFDRIRADPKRTLTFPSPADQKVAHAEFKLITDQWAAESPRHKKLLELAKDELVKIHTDKETAPRASAPPQ